MESNNNILVGTDRVRYLKSSTLTNFDKSLYAESQSALYSGYQQAWRLLGFFVDCSSDLAYGSDTVCTRYLVWAAYVDMDYAGGGLGEYAFYNATKDTYDSKLTCGKNAKGSRCIKMDCHDPDKTSWKLLGLYKQAYYSSKFLYQLFQHEGSCLWDNNADTIGFMENSLQSWPENGNGIGSSTCKMTNYKGANGDRLYIDLKPSYGAYMTFSFYSDAICKTEVEPPGGDANKLKQAAADSGFLSGSDLQTWNARMNVFKYCQPCTSYSLVSTDGNYGPYSCTDSSGKTNVNQCMKFRSNTDMTPMTLSDIEVADRQGGILQINIGGQRYGTSFSSVSTTGTYRDHPYYRTESQLLQQQKTATSLLISSISILVVSMLSLAFMIRWKSQREAIRERQQALQEPLVTDMSGESKSLDK